MDNLDQISTGYMLFVRVFGLWYQRERASRGDKVALLQREFQQSFLGIAARLWRFLPEPHQERWRSLASQAQYNGLKDQALVSEMNNHIGVTLQLLSVQPSVSLARPKQTDM